MISSFHLKGCATKVTLCGKISSMGAAEGDANIFCLMGAAMKAAQWCSAPLMGAATKETPE